ncbi:hypothetical protein PROFUN_13140 [Planoprotostelium fungivorum]|uniref:NmrA-like domain-containing protein n=1 Tax=Planoprotostelium fungivorum TaxID=1890364 RepID=A0A2P6N542_9EUKA|nr:hypothetical protein PROFUN_13140 [Planoprotostelium fungivorum]
MSIERTFIFSPRRADGLPCSKILPDESFQHQPPIKVTIMSYNKVAIAGAGGNVGSAIFKQLYADKYAVTVFTRPGMQSQIPSDVPLVTVDYNDVEALTDALRGQDVFISAINVQRAMGSENVMIDACLRAGVKLFIPSAFSVDFFSEIGQKCAFGLPQHKIAGYARERGQPFIIMTTGPWVELCFVQHAMWGFDVKNRKATIYGDGTTEISGSSFEGVGQAVSAMLRRPEPYINQIVQVSNITFTPNQILAALEKQAGVKYDVQYKPVDDLLKQSEKATDFPSKHYPLMLYTVYAPGGCRWDRTNSDALGLKEGSLEAAIIKAADELTSRQ